MWSGCTWRHRKNALVICVDEKPSIQALERAQGYLKLPNGRALTGCTADDYKRHGTSTLFAAFDGDKKDTKPGAADIVELLEVHDDLPLSLLDQLSQLFLGIGGGLGIQFTFEFQHLYFISES